MKLMMPENSQEDVMYYPGKRARLVVIGAN